MAAVRGEQGVRAGQRATCSDQAGFLADTQVNRTADVAGPAKRRDLAQAEPPTAVLVANVASAVGALHTVYTLGLSVPEDISVIAIHDIPLAGHLFPALTTVRMPLSELGRRAIELLAATSPDDDITETVTEPVEVVVRQSTAPPPERA